MYLCRVIKPDELFPLAVRQDSFALICRVFIESPFGILVEYAAITQPAPHTIKHERQSVHAFYAFTVGIISFHVFCYAIIYLVQEHASLFFVINFVIFS